MMNQRENFFRMLEGNNPEYAPICSTLFDYCLAGTGIADQPWTGGADPFGVKWVVTPDGAIPESGKFLFEEIEDWEEHVKFPDVDSLGIEAAAVQEAAHFDRDGKITCAFSVCGLYERMAAFMGFENTLIALLEDPDSCRDFLDAFSDYKVATITRMIDAYRPDMVVLFDDIATAKSLFMSEDTWRSIFKPYLAKIVKAVRERDVIFAQHTCGKCQSILDDYVEIGVQYWHSAQISNDLPGIMKKYGNKLIVEGGWDSQGPASWIGATEAQVVEETKRCLHEYSAYDNFVLMPVLLNENGNSMMAGDSRMPAIISTWEAGCRHEAAVTA